MWARPAGPPNSESLFGPVAVDQVEQCVAALLAKALEENRAAVGDHFGNIPLAAKRVNLVPSGLTT